MANKKSIEERIEAEKQRTIASKRKKLRFFALGSLLLAAVILLMMLMNWAAISNTDIPGNEVEISGFNCVSAALSGNYKSMDEGRFGNIAVFNYHAAAYTERLAVVSAVAMFVVIAHLLVALFGWISNKQKVFNPLNVAFAVAEAGLFIACHALALSIKDSGILTTYCNNNPACSVQSQAIVAGLIALLSVALPVISMILDKKVVLEAESAALSAAKTPVSVGKKRKNRR